MLDKAHPAPRIDYLDFLLNAYYPWYFFALFRAHELYSLEPFVNWLQDPILDVGCGDGLIAGLLFGRRLSYGIDLSERATQVACKSGIYDSVLTGDAHQTGLESGSLGGIFSNCVLEHIPDMAGLIAEVARLLRPGGYFIASCLSPHYYAMNPVFKWFDKPGLRRIRSRMIEAENRLHNHVSVFDKETYTELFRSNGMLLEDHAYYSTRELTDIVSLRDTLSKYLFPYPVMLRHSGLYTLYLRIRYHRSRQAEQVRAWYQEFRDICYKRNPDNEPGIAQILVARKA